MLFRDYLLLGVILGITNLASAYLVKSTKIWDCSGGADCVRYVSMTEAFLAKDIPKIIETPFNRRPAAPFIASLIAERLNGWPTYGKITNAFQIILILSVNITIVALFFSWKTINIAAPLIVGGLLWLAFHAAGLPFYWSVPVNTDPMAYACMALMILAIVRERYAFLLILAPVATLVKESFIPMLLVIVAVLVMRSIYFRKTERGLLYVCLSLVLSVGVSWLASRYIFIGDSDNLFGIKTLIRMFHRLSREHLRFLRFFAVLFVDYGALFVLTLHRIRLTGERQNNLFLGLGAMSLFLGLLGGVDTTRIVFTFSPFIISIILMTLNTISLRTLMPAFVVSIPIFVAHGLGTPVFLEYAPDNITINWLIYMSFVVPIIIVLDRIAAKNEIVRI